MPPPPQNKAPMNVVEIESSDDEQDDNRGQNRNYKSSNEPQSQVVAPKTVNSSANPPPGSESRSFWKAGAYDIGPIKWTPTIGELEHARVHPKFLHSNATSHKWAFGAIAELLDNAVDEICNGATFVMVDRIFSKRDNSPALLFQDDGGGMNPEGIRKCMSLGYSSKKTNSTIGQYGNGFKTSTMRLGADVIVFTRACSKSQITQSVGLLSYTFLRRTGQDDVIVPMIDFNVSDHWAEPIIYGSQDDWSTNLKTILEWSPFESKDDLMQQFQNIGPHGTKIIVYNLWLNDEGIYELNFDEDDEDIRLRDEANRGGVSKLNKRVLELQSHISYRIRYSLRDYASMLYLRKLKNFKILLRGKPVEQFNIADELKYKETVTYRPQLTSISKEVVAETTLGFIKEAPSLGVCGYNVYHKNRLIRPFWKVTGDGNSKGHGVVGVLEANFIEPAHDKQDFERSSVFTRLEMRLKQMLMEYWKSHCHLIGHNPDPSFVRKMQKEGAPQPHIELSAANAQMHHATGGNTVRLSAIPRKEMHVNQPIVGLAANPRQDLGGAPPQGKTGYGPSVAVQPSNTGFDQEVACVDGSRGSSIDQICDENIQLFMRCEEQVQKQSELKNTIQELEKQVAETKRKCAELSSHIETQKRKLLPQQASRS